MMGQQPLRRFAASRWVCSQPLSNDNQADSRDCGYVCYPWSTGNATLMLRRNCYDSGFIYQIKPHYRHINKNKTKQNNYHNSKPPKKKMMMMRCLYAGKKSWMCSAVLRLLTRSTCLVTLKATSSEVSCDRRVYVFKPSQWGYLQLSGSLYLK